MSLAGFLEKTIDDFRGAWPELDQAGQSPSRASLAQNVSFAPEKVFTRDGFAPKYSFGAGAVQSLYNWITNVASRLVYFQAPNLVRMINLQSDIVDSLYTQAARGISVAEAGSRLYIAHYDSAGAPTGNLRVVNALIGGVPADTAFPNPMTAGFTVTDQGAGACTAGVHKFGYCLETRTGFPGKPGPQTAGTFTPVSFDVPAGGKTLRFSMTAAIPDDGAFIHVLMTTAANTEQYFFVPGASLSVPGGSPAFLVQIDFSISDEQLAASANEATDAFSYLTQNSGAPAPSKVVSYGNRMVYIAGNKAYFSDPYSYQALAEDRNAIQVQNQKDLVTGAEVRGMFALFGPTWTFIIPSGPGNLFPREWGPPVSVSNAIGTRAPEGVAAGPGAQYLWVASEQGLFYFDGQYSEVPVSWLQDWKRINWAAAINLMVVDNAARRTVHVLAPLDGATEPTHILSFDYSRARTDAGINPTAVDYSLDNYAGGAISSLATVQNFTTKNRELWLGLPNGDALRQEKGRRNDNNQKITSIYETGQILQPGDRQRTENIFGGAHFQVLGSGTLTVAPYGINRVTTPDDPVHSITLEAAPPATTLRMWHLRSRNQTIRVSTDAIGHWFELAEMIPYWKPVGDRR